MTTWLTASRLPLTWLTLTPSWLPLALLWLPLGLLRLAASLLRMLRLIPLGLIPDTAPRLPASPVGAVLAVLFSLLPLPGKRNTTTRASEGTVGELRIAVRTVRHAVVICVTSADKTPE